VAHTEHDGHILEKLEFDNGAGATVYGYLLLPAGRAQPGPAILYQHYHGGKYELGKDEIFAPWSPQVPAAKVLVDAGYVVLAIDAYAFGERQHQGPAGQRESGAATESSLFKQFLWEGATLWGMMVRDDILALNYLLSRPEVDPAQVGTTGMSMGATRAWWLAALDERIKATVAVACLTRYQDLIARGDLWYHSIYYFVPAILRESIDMEAVVGLIAPRPLLTLTGDEDVGSPVDGVRLINAWVRDVYELYGAADSFEGRVYAEVGHEYTPAMWAEMLAWFQRHLT
jgi:dienelactone hydrolase